MRTLDEMQLRSEDVIARATDRGTDKLPTPEETKLAGDNIKLISLFRRCEQLTQGIWKEWVGIKHDTGIK